jgi:hypothetical protein
MRSLGWSMIWRVHLLAFLSLLLVLNHRRPFVPDFALAVILQATSDAKATPEKLLAKIPLLQGCFKS